MFVACDAFRGDSCWRAWCRLRVQRPSGCPFKDTAKLSLFWFPHRSAFHPPPPARMDSSRPSSSRPSVFFLGSDTSHHPRGDHRRMTIGRFSCAVTFWQLNPDPPATFEEFPGALRLKGGGIMNTPEVALPPGSGAPGALTFLLRKLPAKIRPLPLHLGRLLPAVGGTPLTLLNFGFVAQRRWKAQHPTADVVTVPAFVAAVRAVRPYC